MANKSGLQPYSRIDVLVMMATVIGGWISKLDFFTWPWLEVYLVASKLKLKSIIWSKRDSNGFKLKDQIRKPAISKFKSMKYIHIFKNIHFSKHFLKTHLLFTLQSLLEKRRPFLGGSPVVLGQYWSNFILIVRFSMTFWWVSVCETLNQSLIYDISELLDALKMFHSARKVSCRVATWRHDEG